MNGGWGMGDGGWGMGMRMGKVNPRAFYKRVRFSVVMPPILSCLVRPTVLDHRLKTHQLNTSFLGYGLAACNVWMAGISDGS